MAGRDILSCVVRFRVMDQEAEEGYAAETWKNRELFQSWISYYTAFVMEQGKKDICYVTGEYTVCTGKHTEWYTGVQTGLSLFPPMKMEALSIPETGSGKGSMRCPSAWSQALRLTAL